MAVAIGNLGTIPILTVGGRVFTDLTNLIFLIGSVNTAGRGCTGRKAGAASGYQVTAGKTLTIYAVKITCEDSAGAYGITLSQSDNDVGVNTATALTNAVVLCPLTTGFAIYAPASTGGQTTLEVSLPVLAAKYLTGQASITRSGDFYTYGYEA